MLLQLTQRCYHQGTVVASIFHDVIIRYITLKVKRLDKEWFLWYLSVELR